MEAPARALPPARWRPTFRDLDRVKAARSMGTGARWERRFAAVGKKREWERFMFVTSYPAWLVKLLYHHARTTSVPLGHVMRMALMGELALRGYDVAGEAARVEAARDEWLAKEREKAQGGK